MMPVHHPQTPRHASSQLSSASWDVKACNSSMVSVPPASINMATPASSVSGSGLVLPPSRMSTTMSPPPVPSAKRKRGSDTPDRPRKRTNASKITLEKLHMNLEPYYKVLSNPLAKPSQVVDFSQDLFEMFDLNRIAATVARTDDKGEKNSLRKSYKGQMKSLNIDGQFDAVKREPTDPNHLYTLCTMPELEYNVHLVKGKELENGLDDILDLVDLACTMEKGSVASIFNTAVLGGLAPGKRGRETAPNTPRPVSALKRPKTKAR